MPLEINVEVLSGSEKARITFKTDPPAWIEVGADELEHLVAAFAHVRASLQPPVPDDFAALQATQGVENPSWRVEKEIVTDGVLVHIRHPGYGWSHFVLRPESARKMAHFLTEVAEAQEQIRPPSKSN